MDVMDEALDLLGDAGPEYGPGFSNHAPMAAEALLALGRGDAVMDWVTAYRKRLPGSPQPGLPVFGGYWFEALGASAVMPTGWPASRRNCATRTGAPF